MNISTSVSAIPDVTLEIIDGIKVVVPDSLELLTPYVLREQLDWFEDEIKFVRTLLQPGDVVLDIGANYGLYALSMAKVVGESGHVYAFEPASKTASYLQRSIEQNKFNHITLVRAALSKVSGKAEFCLNENSELNSLNTSIASSGKTETVDLITLDMLEAELSVKNVKFIKLDAEGEEGNILLGGDLFLKNSSPLIMFELKHLDQINTPLVQQFNDIGYQLYRLIPGLNVLAPFSLDEPLDDFQLNLFACKDDCAMRLERDGKLVKNDSKLLNVFDAPKDWEEFILQYPYAQYLKSKWDFSKQNVPIVGAEQYLEILASYAGMRATVSANTRHLKLKQASADLNDLCTQNPTLPRLISLSRIESEFGQRSLALVAIGKALSMVMRGDGILNEPFLAASSRFEMINPQNKVTNWVLASLLEQLEKLNFFSSYYSGQKTLSQLIAIRNTGFQGEEMERRIGLIKSRFAILC